MYSTRAAKQDCSVVAKKMEPIIGIDKEGEARRRAGAEQRDGTSYKRSAGVERSEGNRQTSENCVLATANEQSGDTRQKQRQNLFCKMFLSCIRAILTKIGVKKVEPIIGIEPMTCSLRVSCSTD